MFSKMIYLWIEIGLSLPLAHIWPATEIKARLPDPVLAILQRGVLSRIEVITVWLCLCAYCIVCVLARRKFRTENLNWLQEKSAVSLWHELHRLTGERPYSRCPACPVLSVTMRCLIEKCTLQERHRFRQSPKWRSWCEGVLPGCLHVDAGSMIISSAILAGAPLSR